MRSLPAVSVVGGGRQPHHHDAMEVHHLTPPSTSTPASNLTSTTTRPADTTGHRHRRTPSNGPGRGCCPGRSPLESPRPPPSGEGGGTSRSHPFGSYLPKTWAGSGSGCHHGRAARRMVGGSLRNRCTTKSWKRRANFHEITEGWASPPASAVATGRREGPALAASDPVVRSITSVRFAQARDMSGL